MALNGLIAVLKQHEIETNYARDVGEPVEDEDKDYEFPEDVLLPYKESMDN